MLKLPITQRKIFKEKLKIKEKNVKTIWKKTKHKNNHKNISMS